MSPLHAVAAILFLVGVGVVVMGSLLALPLRGPKDRLHALAAMTSLGTPLVTLGLILRHGWSPTSAQVALIGLLVAVTGPVLSSAAARVAGMRDGSVPRETPQ